MNRARKIVAITALASSTALASGPVKKARPDPPPPFSTPVEQCIIPAASYQNVNPHVLRAILVVESSLKPSVVATNRNGTVDVGMAGINSIHFPTLAKFGVAPDDLKNPCVASYVGAWILRRVMNQGGNTWAGIASYHSSTPYFNRRYQILLHNELVRSGVIAGSKLPVPPLDPGRRSDPGPAGKNATAQAAPAVVYDLSARDQQTN